MVRCSLSASTPYEIIDLFFFFFKGRAPPRHLPSSPPPPSPDGGAAGGGRGTSPPAITTAGWDSNLSGSRYRFGDYQPGERIDHVDGITVEEAEHMLAARLYQ